MSKIRFQLAGVIFLVGLLGCSGGEKNEAHNRAELQTPASKIPNKPNKKEKAWKDRYSGVPPAGDPRLKDLSYLQRLEPSAETEVAIGDYFLFEAQPDSAADHYQLALNHDPKNLVAMNRLATALQRLGEMKKAEESLLAAIELDPFYIHSHINLGTLNMRQNRYEKAISEYRLATTIDSTNAVVWFNLGLAYQKSEMNNPAIRAYQKAMEIDPDDPKPWEQTGWIHYGSKLYKGARECWTEALQRDPNNERLKSALSQLEAYRDSTNTP
ncbi:MAG: tetratricopeptide repeat protein [Candidatus Eisenbacteria bacterium]|uniref:Tetratricopeptide repeat protein n=1 Tax=Eiseniibacteriota bacterium TaxID=2212470 RepID=A0A7Y2H265_UNCEI|nr:tetratricopeptide repeat protein [Candidatus Eisenbacteria bacterium]